MRNKLSVFIFILFFCIFMPKLNASEKAGLPIFDSEQTISMDLQDAKINDIMKIFSMQSGLNFIASEAVQERKVTLYLDKVPIKEAMDKIFKANNLSYELGRDSNIFIVKDWGKPMTETVTKVFSLKYARLPTSNLKKEIDSSLGGATTTGSEEGGGEEKAATGDIVASIKEILSEYGKVSEDSRTNSLIVTDIPSRMPVIEQVIAKLDVSTPQVMLEVEMLDVSKNAIDKIGLKFGQTPVTMVLTGAKMTGLKWPLHSPSTPTNAVPGITTGNMDFSQATYTVLLDFLKTQTDTKYLARPRILTLNNETAELRITTQEAVGVSSTAVTTSSTATTTAPERVETGVHLRVTPQINLETGEITMLVVPTVKDTSTSTILIANAGTNYYKDPEERSTTSVVRVKDGETVIIGGLIRNDSVETVTKLPILGDIPFLGRLFTHKDKSRDRQRELLVFITPHIIKESNIELAQAKKALLLPQREQDAFPGINRKALISSSLNTFEKKKR